MELKCSVGRGQFFKARESLEVDRRKRGSGLGMKLVFFLWGKKEKTKVHNMKVELFKVLGLIVFQNLRLFPISMALKKVTALSAKH